MYTEMLLRIAALEGGNGTDNENGSEVAHRDPKRI